jgi:hypothetical protein
MRRAELTWTLLYHLGAVTHHQKPTHLRIPNTAMRVLVSTVFLHIKEVFLIISSFRYTGGSTKPNLDSGHKWLNPTVLFELATQLRLSSY